MNKTDIFKTIKEDLETAAECGDNNAGNTLFNDIVEKGMPPVGQPLIVTIKDNLQGMPNQLRYPVYYVKDTMKDQYCWKWLWGDMVYDLVPDVSEVIAWQLFPKPYQPEKYCSVPAEGFNMQEAFEKVLKELNKKKDYFQNFFEKEGKTEEDNNINTVTQLAFNDAIDIVKQVADEYN